MWIHHSQLLSCVTSRPNMSTRSIFTMMQVFFNGFKCNFNCDFFATRIFFMSDIDYLDNISKQHEKGKTQRQSSDLKSTIHYATFFSATVCSNWKLHGQTCEHIQTANHSCNQWAQLFLSQGFHSDFLVDICALINVKNFWSTDKDF